MTKLEKKNMTKSIETIQEFIQSLKTQKLDTETQSKIRGAETALNHLGNLNKNTDLSSAVCHNCNGNER